MLKGNYLSVLERRDFTHLTVITIDPPGCVDADDGFSIYHDLAGEMHLALHFADPTDFLPSDSKKWEGYETQLQSRYSLLARTNHLFPSHLVERASLRSNVECTRNAITLTVPISESFLPTAEPEILFTTVSIRPENALTYHRAGMMAETFNKYTSNEYVKTLWTSKQIADALLTMRGGAPQWRQMSRIFVTRSGIVCLEKPSKEEIKMRQVIAEFAIFANTAVAKVLSEEFGGEAIFRACPSGKGQYTCAPKNHEKLGRHAYTHFTSPLRRWTDCVCHLLLKFLHHRKIVEDVPLPYTAFRIETIAAQSNQLVKQLKRESAAETRDVLRTYIHQKISDRCTVTVEYVVESYSPERLSVKIQSIDGHEVYLRYVYPPPISLRVSKRPQKVYLTTINIDTEQDEGSLPDLELALNHDLATSC